jgi:hypothetical protein
MLLTEITTGQVDLPEYVQAYIQEYCQSYINEVGNNEFLYRGISKSRLAQLTMMSRMPGCAIIPGHYEVRKPVSVPQEYHNLANELFVKYHGLPYRNGLFVTGDRASTKSYGAGIIVIPVGEFKYCYSAQVKDMFDIVPESEEWFDEDEFSEVIRNQYTTNNLQRGMKLHTEIMLYCDKCLAYII